MKWFKHFTNAKNSGDLTKVRMKYGADGYAIYWYCLECIAADLGNGQSLTFELKHDAEVVGFDLKIDQVKVEEIMRYMVKLGLFEEANHTITCLKLAKYLDKKITRNQEIHAIIDKSNELLDSPRQSPTSPDSLPTVTEPSPLDKKRREENINNMAKSEDLPFSDFWSVAPKKTKKKRSEQIWKKLNKTERKKAIEDIQTRYVTRERKYIPDPSAYLNGEYWEDEKEQFTQEDSPHVI